MKIANNWQDYEIIATGSGMKLERWKDIHLLRPDPQVIWPSKFDLETYPKLNAIYRRSNKGGGYWDVLKPYAQQWEVGCDGIKFLVKPMGFKHTGLFPEQAVNWQMMKGLITAAKRPIKVLNLFAYTGGATVACAAAGAQVCHVDAAKNMVDRAKSNIILNNLDNAGTRYIVEDCRKFVEREIRRNNTYDAVIMDPPSYGRGPSGEMWKLEDELFSLVRLCVEVLSDNPLFFLINSYTTGLQPLVLKNILELTMPGGQKQAYEVGLPADRNTVLPCGASGFYTNT